MDDLANIKAKSQTNLHLPVIAVVIGNLIPIYGVIFFGWSLFDLLYLYWAENILIGIFTLLRMFLSAVNWGATTIISTAFLMGFFTFHYGLFCFVHGMILFDLFGDTDASQDFTPSLLIGYVFSENRSELLWALVGIALVVVTESVRNIIKDKKDASLPQSIMFTPYGRIIVLHITILFGGLATQALGSPIWALCVLAIVKTAYDIFVVSDKSYINFDTSIKEST